MADNVVMRDFFNVQKTMRATDKGTSFVPHHIVDAVALAPVVSSALEKSHILSAVACSLVELDVYVDATTDGYIMLLDSATVPADGTVAPKKFWKIVLDSQLQYSPKYPLKFINGCVVVFSTTGPLIKTTTTTTHAFFSGQMAAATGEAS